MNKIYVIVLAAGKGKRMNSSLPKVLHKISKRSMLSYTLDTLEKLDLEIVIVVGHKKEQIYKLYGDKYIYAEQKEPLGTGHAVLSAKPKVPKKIKAILVLMGDDSAFYKPKTLRALIEQHLKNKNAITFLSLKAQDPTGLGRIKRDKQKKILGIIEEKNATSKEKEIREINLGTYCFASDFLWKNLPKLPKNQISKEYYLTDLIALAVKNHQKIQATPLRDPNEWKGINTRKQLQEANKLMKKCQNTKKSKL